MNRPASSKPKDKGRDQIRISWKVKGQARGGRRRTPDEVLKLPHGSDTGDLENESSIVVEHGVDLLEESRVLPDADVLQEEWSASR
jgi:hypothetical protein